jgi:hypothetical protein
MPEWTEDVFSTARSLRCSSRLTVQNSVEQCEGDHGINGSSQPHTGQPEPRVGIFWLIGQRLVIGSMPLSKASKYGDCKIYEGDHITLWSEMEKRGEVPRDTDYEENSRGRANFNMKTQQFNLFLDRCIMRKKNVVKKLMLLMHLPSDTELSTDDQHERAERQVAAMTHSNQAKAIVPF